MRKPHRRLVPEGLIEAPVPARESRIVIGIDFHTDGRALLSASVGGKHAATYGAMPMERLPQEVEKLLAELLAERRARIQLESGCTS